MDRMHCGRHRLPIFVSVLVLVALCRLAFGQEDEALSPKIGMVSIEAVDAVTGQNPEKDAAAVDYKISWEFCAPEQKNGEAQWSVESFQAYFWNTPAVVGDPESPENLPPAGADSSGFTRDIEFTFKGKEANQQSYFAIKGLLKDADSGLLDTVWSPVSMDIFPRPVFAATLLQDFTDWIRDKGWRTWSIVLVNVAIFVFGIYWACGCYKRQKYGNLFPHGGVTPEAIAEKIIKRGPDKANPLHGSVVDALEKSLHGVRNFRPSENYAAVDELPAYRIIESAVQVYLSPGSTNADIQAALDRQVGVELMELRTESKVDWIWNASYVEPLVGLFGTVTGLTAAFMSKAADRESDMYAGIYEALFTTIAGLAFGIVLVLIYNFCDDRFHRIEGAFQKLAAELAVQLRK